MAKKGLFIAIEGVDGSGKATQVAKLKESLESAGYTVELVDFPRYNHESAYYVKQYLAGNYGTAEELGPFTPSLFYSLDRYDASAKIKKALEQNKIVIADRFTGSNMAHQGQKFNNIEEKKRYWNWIEKLEFEMLGIPRPNLNLVLTIPTEVSLNLIKNRAQKDATRASADIHEADDDHIRRALDSFIELIDWAPDRFTRIECSRSCQLMSIDEIANLVWNKIEPILPEDKSFLDVEGEGSQAELEVESEKLDVNLSPEANELYTKTTNQILSIRQQLVDSLKPHLAQNPEAEINIESVASKLTMVGTDFQLSKNYPELSSAIKSLGINQPAVQSIPEIPGVKLIDYYPKNELDIASSIIYQNSNLSFQHLKPASAKPTTPLSLSYLMPVFQAIFKTMIATGRLLANSTIASK